MSLGTWFSGGKTRNVISKRHTRARIGQAIFRPWLERLEDRTLLSAGNLDSTFGAMGVATTHFITGGISTGESVLVQPDGKVVLAAAAYVGSSANFAVARFNSDGTPDTSYGTGGQVVTPFFDFNGTGLSKALLQPDGKIVAVGNVGNTMFADVGLVRYNPDGSLDSSFGTGGKADTHLGDFVESVSDAVLQSDGKIVVLAKLAAGAPELLRYNINGTLDSSFGIGGILGISFGDRLALLPDGRLVVAANDAVGRYNNDGTLDFTFGTRGSIRTGLGPKASSADSEDIALQPDGKIVFAGTTQNNQLALLRYNINGNVDATFGVGGLTTLPPSQTPYALAIDNNGRIIVSGNVFTGAGSFVERFQPNGVLDASFDAPGNGALPTFPFDLAVQADGKILVAGTHGIPFSNPSDASVARLLTDDPLPTANQRFVAQIYLDLLQRTVDAGGLNEWAALLDQGQTTRTQVVSAIETSLEFRAIEVQSLFGQLLNRAPSADEVMAYSQFLSSNGTVEQMRGVLAGSPEYMLKHAGPNNGLLEDPGFGMMGVASTQLVTGGTSNGMAVLAQPDGKIVLVATNHSITTSTSDFALARFNADGTLDTTFGTSGKVLTDVIPGGSNNVDTALLQPDGKIVVAGTVESDVGLARYNPDGTLDTGFGTRGTVDTSFQQPAETTGAALQADGKIIVIATIIDHLFAMLRYTANGTLDGSFGTGGVLPLHFGNSVALQLDGRIVVASNFALARFNADGSPDTSFGMHGTISTGLPTNLSTSVVVLQHDDKIVFAGSTPDGQLTLFRYNADGTPDSTFGAAGTDSLPGFGAPTALAIEANGGIVVCSGAFNQSPFLLHLESKGMPVMAVGNGFSPLNLPSGLALQADGNILLAGTDGSAGASSASVARLLAAPTTSQQADVVLDALYRDALNRFADPVGRNEFVQALASGTLTLRQTADVIFGSVEYSGVLAQLLYRRYLHRDVDAAERNAIVAAREDGVSEETLISVIVGSDEYLARRT
jgi:uncharacterized delta-60 repeat protein